MEQIKGSYGPLCCNSWRLNRIGMSVAIQLLVGIRFRRIFIEKKINQGIRNNSFDYTADTVRVIKSMIDTSFASLMKSIGLYVTNLIRSDNTYLMLLFLD